jgi:hypothetical protein
MRSSHTRSIAHILILGLLSATGAMTADTNGPATVRLPLEDYLRLTSRVVAVENAAKEAAATKEPAIAQVVRQERLVRITDDDDTAAIEQTAWLEMRGGPRDGVALKVTGVPWRADVSPAGSVLTSIDHGVELLPVTDGTAEIHVRSVARLADGGGVRRLVLASDAAPVAVTRVELPADLAWKCPGAVVAANVAEDGVRHLELALVRGGEHTLELRREVRGGEAERTHAQSVVVTVLSLGGDGLRRHDVVLYEVARGGLDVLEAELPSGLTPERVATDEGEQPLVVDGNRLVIARKQRLTSSGWLAVTSRLEAGAAPSIAGLTPAVASRARYLTVATSVAAGIRPEPEAAWQRVDLADLPATLREAASALGVAAAWRLADDDATPRVAIDRLPPAELEMQVIENRDTLTMLTVEGTLLHRDRLRVRGGVSALELELAEGSTVWSASVDGVAVRWLERGGKTLVPLPFGSERPFEVEVVTVAERAIERGRGSLAIGLPAVTGAVRHHRWRLLLPEDHRYRYLAGDLLPAVARSWAGTKVARTRRASVREGLPSGTTQGLRALGGNAALRGGARDDQGLGLPGATIELSSSSLTSGPMTTTTSSDGEFEFLALPSGIYRLQASLDGFQSSEIQDLRVRSDDNLRLSMVLPMALPDESPSGEFYGEIEVTSELPTVDSTQVNTGQVFTTSRARGRSYSSGISRKPKAKPAPPPPVELDLSDLKQGLVGGVRPVPVAIPERGKMLELEGVLPPAVVTVVLGTKNA